LGGTVVIVDTLSFSTAVAVAVSRGARVIPCRSREEALNQTDAIVAARRGEPGFSLSPGSLLAIPTGSTLALPTPNGATCCVEAASASRLLVGSLVNASAVAAACQGHVTVVACGEQWGEGPGRRWALEDDLGAGAILARLDGGADEEASACVAAFRGTEGTLANALLDYESGRELIERGYREDVLLAGQLDWLDVAPVLRAGYLAA
jgi:2-phosphosulfolactate phosphatase